jgi:hypothetical protein
MDKTDIALKQFDIAVRYASFETGMYWSRSQFFLVANSTLLGFTASSLLRGNLTYPYFWYGLCIFGAGLSVFWYLTLRAGQYWIDRWERLCMKFEPEALGEVEMFRNCRSDTHMSTKTIARMIACLFVGVWLLAALYAGFTTIGVTH